MRLRDGTVTNDPAKRRSEMKNLDLLLGHDTLCYTNITKFNDNWGDGRVTFVDKDGNSHEFRGPGWHLWESK